MVFCLARPPFCLYMCMYYSISRYGVSGLSTTTFSTVLLAASPLAPTLSRALIQRYWIEWVLINIHLLLIASQGVNCHHWPILPSAQTPWNCLHLNVSDSSPWVAESDINDSESAVIFTDAEKVNAWRIYSDKYCVQICGENCSNVLAIVIENIYDKTDDMFFLMIVNLK